MTELFTTTLGTTGPPVVFLHGLFGQGKNWTTLARQLSVEARVTLVDLPDHGRSGWSARFSYPDMADAIAERLADRSGAGEPVAVIGHSMGGKVAMALALRHPHAVSRLGVVDIAPTVTDEISSFAAYVAGMQAIDLATLTGRDQADAQLTPFVPDPTVRSFLLQNLRRDGQGWRWQMNLALLGDSLTAMGGWPQLGAPPYTGPVLWIAGAESPYVQPSSAPTMRALFPRVQLVRIKGARHWVHSDQPEVFAATVRRFLGV